MVGSYQKYPEGLRGCSLTSQCSRVCDSAVSVLTQAEVVSDSGRKLPKSTPKDCEGVYYHYSVHKLEIARVRSNGTSLYED